MNKWINEKPNKINNYKIKWMNKYEWIGLNELNELKTIEDKVEWIYSRLMMDQGLETIFINFYLIQLK